VTSPLARARETAAILAERLGTRARRVAGLRELDAGSWSGLTRAEVERRFPLAIARFRAGDLELRAGGEGESRRELRVRVVAALRGLVAEESALPLLVVGHLGALRTLLPDVRLGNAELLELPAAVLAESPAGACAAAPAARAMGDER
jgi:broad specificity phosphatase PhoE